MKLAAAALALMLALPLEAQRAVLQVAVDQHIDAPSVRSSGLFADGTLRDLLVNGFPARLHYRIERWTTRGWFDDIEAAAEWDVVLRYDALRRTYEVFRVAGGRTFALGKFEAFDGADAAINAAYRAPIAPPRRGQRIYYNLVLEIEMLSLTELDELERWLRGELKPAVRGKKNPGTALSRGVRTVFVRILGGEKRRYEARSSTFRP